MKKILSIILAVSLVATFCIYASAGAVDGFTAATGHEDIFNMKDGAISCKSAGNPILMYNTDSGNADYTIEVKAKPSSNADCYAVVGVASTTTWVSGLFLKLSKSSAELYDFSTGAFVGIEMKTGVTSASLNITADYNSIKITKISGKYKVYVNNILAFENIELAGNAVSGTKISLGANNTVEVECFFKDFKYTSGSTSSTNNTDTSDNMTFSLISVITLFLAAAGIYFIKNRKIVRG